ncbi:hypothetical protein CBR_g34247 [Chara braunii]|uniref:Uncharacterized protein n=1 Tax=Chara braunii TaxID=69332 RepID=A0A388JYM7_CHABU|nr:hypothetical protein CBR_g34247 [Chara braunii]|eukprot:GBG62875.1 hypothetical protein CBR_g34247 [Chara braunii]
MNRAYRANTRKRQRAATAMVAMATNSQMICMQAVRAKGAVVGSRSKRRRPETSTSVTSAAPEIVGVRAVLEPVAESGTMSFTVPEAAPGTEAAPLAGQGSAAPEGPGFAPVAVPVSVSAQAPTSVPLALPGSLGVALAAAPGSPASPTAASWAAETGTSFDGAAGVPDAALLPSLGMWEEAFEASMAEAVGREAEEEESRFEQIRIEHSFFPVTTELSVVSIRNNSSAQAVDLAGTASTSTSNRSMELGLSSRPIDVDDDEDVREVSPSSCPASRPRRDRRCNGGYGAFVAAANIRILSNVAVAQSNGVTTIDLEASPPRVDLTAADDACGSDDCIVLSETPQNMSGAHLLGSILPQLASEANIPITNNGFG